MIRFFKTTIFTILFMATMIQCANSQSTPRDRNCFHHHHYNVGGVCLLSSYGFLLEYANSTDEHVAPFDNFDMMSEYMLFHNNDEPCPCYSADYFRRNQIAAEEDLSKAINGYCMERGWSGYIRINQFHDWLKANKDWADNIEFVKRAPQTLNNNGQPYPNAYADMASYLEQNSNPNANYDFAALICYMTDGGCHSVFLGYDNDYFIRDVNHYDRYVDKSCSFGFSYGPEAPILEYAVYKVKRPVGITKEWKHYDVSKFKTSKKAEGDFMVLDNPIPLKHLRVTSYPYGADGAREYSEIKIRSFSDPDYELVYGNYYGIPVVCINGEFVPIGQRTAKGCFEFDLGQLSEDLFIWGYQPNFNFDNFQYQ